MDIGGGIEICLFVDILLLLTVGVCSPLEDMVVGGVCGGSAIPTMDE